MTLAAIIQRKGSPVVMDRTAPLSDVTAALVGRSIGLAAVLDAAGALEGVVSERDVLRMLAAHGAAALTMTAEQAMTRKVVTATPETSMDQAMAMMTVGGFRHLPVLDNGKLAGIISVRDVVRAQVDINQYEVQTLRAYLASEQLASGAPPPRLHA